MFVFSQAKSKREQEICIQFKQINMKIGKHVETFHKLVYKLSEVKIKKNLTVQNGLYKCTRENCCCPTDYKFNGDAEAQLPCKYIQVNWIIIWEKKIIKKQKKGKKFHNNCIMIGIIVC